MWFGYLLAAPLAAICAILWATGDSNKDGRSNIWEFVNDADTNGDGTLSGSESAWAAAVPLTCFVFGLLMLIAAARITGVFKHMRKASKAYARSKSLEKKSVAFSTDLDDSLVKFVDTECSMSVAHVQSLARSVSKASSAQPASSRSRSGSYATASRKSKSTPDLERSASIEQALEYCQANEELCDLGAFADLEKWDYDTFDLAAKTEHCLTITGMSCLQDILSNIPPTEREVVCDVPKLKSFLSCIEDHYKEVPYHSQLHGATVARSAFSMCKDMGLGSKLAGRMEFALVLAGLVHDVGHPGLTAPFLIKARHDLSITYSDDSPLERMHLSIAFRMLQQDKNRFLSDEEFDEMKPAIVRCVLGTDMVKHGQQLQRLEALKDNLKHGGSDGTIPWYWPSKPPPRAELQTWALEEQVLFVMELYLHAADIASPTMQFNQFKRWNNAVQEEFFNQGDREKAEFGELISIKDGYDRNAPEYLVQKFTLGFVNFLVTPLFSSLDALSKLEVDSNITLGVDLSICMENLTANTKSLEEEVKKLAPKS